MEQRNSSCETQNSWHDSCSALSRKRGITLSKEIGGLPSLLVWVPLIIVNNYSEFQVNIFSNNRDIRKMSKFSHDANAAAASVPARAMTIP